MVTAGRGTAISRLEFEFLFPNSTEITNENIFKGWRTGKGALREKEMTGCRWGGVCTEGGSNQYQEPTVLAASES